jgi:putative endonuclease
MSKKRKQLGDRGEDLAALFLQGKGFEILERQYKISAGEIDLICRDKGEIVFVEVKTRQTETFGYPEESVTPDKIRHIMSVVQNYLRKSFCEDAPWRVDIVAIQIKDSGPDIVHFEGIDMN